MRSPSSALVDATVMPIFFRMAPDRKPRTEWGCQPVAFRSSFSVTPLGRFSRPSTLAVLLPSRAPAAFRLPLGAFLAALALGADLAFLGATCARRAATRAFLACFGSLALVAGAVPVSSSIDVIVWSPFGGGYCDHMNHSVYPHKQVNSVGPS